MVDNHKYSVYNKYIIAGEQFVYYKYFDII